LAKALVVYASKYGNTRTVAETIIEGINQTPGIETTISNFKDVDFDRVAEFDAVLIGSPNHAGNAVGGIKKVINRLGKSGFKGKGIAVFDTYMGKAFETAVKKMEKLAKAKIPGVDLLAPGLSIEVKGMQGPIADGELPKCKEFGASVASRLTKS
jgi:flavorubredoxin